MYQALKMSPGQLELLTGINERRWWEPNYPLSKGAAAAGKKALASASMTAAIDLLKQAAEVFVQKLLPEDKASVGAFNDKIQLSGTFTNNRDELIGALNDLYFGNPTRLNDAIATSLDALQGVPPAQRTAATMGPPTPAPRRTPQLATRNSSIRCAGGTPSPSNSPTWPRRPPKPPRRWAPR
mgnify:CR=1 FL=1